jgi:hypothetical protein
MSAMLLTIVSWICVPARSFIFSRFFCGERPYS